MIMDTPQNFCFGVFLYLKDMWIELHEWLCRDKRGIVMGKVFFKIGAVIVKMLVRSRLEGKLQENCEDIVSILESLGLDEYEARNVNRGFEDIGDNIAASCTKILEKSNIEPERIEIIAQYVLKSYEFLNCSYKNIFDYINSEELLRKKLLLASKEYVNELDTRERELFERLIEHTVYLIINASCDMPQFTQEGIKRLVGRMDSLCEKINQILGQINHINDLVEDKSVKIQNFERSYRNKILSRYSYINLFGANGLEREYRKYKLDIAYVELEICYKNTEKNISVEQFFKQSKNIWLVGEAGSGKTTFLQWIAMCSAGNRQEIEGVRDSIPIFIELRKMNEIKNGLRGCILSVMKDSSYDIPDGWIEELIELGKFIFLIDGFDEIDEKAREKILNWLDEVDGKNICKKVFTSRPQVKERPALKDLVEARILPMNTLRKKSFIEYWHKAVLVEQLKLDSEEVKRISFKLYEKINQSDSLQKLASNPLLCAMICALHYRNDMNLPCNKRELYEECCKMLLEKRDQEREIVVNDIRINYERKKIIMAKLAYWMMRNNYVEISKEQAEEVVKLSIVGMGLGSTDEIRIFKYLLERSGLLREPEIDKIEFIHRTFQEYLSAYEISREADWGYLKEKIGDSTWQETIGICIGFAKKEIATELIQDTLNKGEKSQKQSKYLFLAITYLAGAIEVDELLRTRIEGKLKKKIPPNKEECYGLSEAGNLAVPYLACESHYTSEARLNCIRTLRMIGSEKALKIAMGYMDASVTKAEIKELGILFSGFNRKVLIQNDILYYVKKYICEQEGDSLIIHNEFIRIMDWIYEENNKIVFEKVKKLSIIDYQGNELKKYNNCFRNVEELTIEGNFRKIPILDIFKGLRVLDMVCQNCDFSFNKLNDYKNIYNIKEFSVVFVNEEYIDGSGLYFLNKCEKMRIVAMNQFTEIFFDKFSCLENLVTLEVGAEYALDFDYSKLPSNIKNLVIYIPKALRTYAVYLMEELDMYVLIEDYETIVSGI